MYTYTRHDKQGFKQLQRPLPPRALSSGPSRIAPFLIAALLAILGACAKEAPNQYKGYALDWQDEFNGKAIKNEYWRHAVGGGGYGNNEMQYYTNAEANSRVEKGLLIIEARREKKAGWPYTSAKLQSLQRKSMLYGRVELRAKLPRGKGSWPAIWMLPEDSAGYGVGWPDSGEIDLMEHVGYEQGAVHFTVHTAAYNHKLGTQRGASLSIPDAAETFHVYGMEWTPSFIRFYVDGQTVFQHDNPGTGWQAWPFDKPFYLILNIACGGDWGGREGIDNESLPWRMEVDWVRVYRYLGD